MNGQHNNKIWISRVLVGIVLFLNVQSAVAFLVKPEVFVASFELIGEVGKITLRGFGILFLMWNVPYIFAVFHPVRNFTSLLEANLMQLIGLAGESVLLITMSEGHTLLAGSILRFVVFDGAGLILLIAAGWIAYSVRRGLILPGIIRSE